MSHCADRRRQRTGRPRWRVLTCWLALLAASLGWTSGTAARADEPVTRVGAPCPSPAEVVAELGTGTPRIVVLRPRGGALTVRARDQQSIATHGSSASGEDVRLDANLSFAKDSAELLPAARTRLSEVARVLAAREPGRVTITGHTDDLGSAEHGLTLSRRRAEAVRSALSAGLGGHQVVVSGRGEAEPLVPNDSEANRARNRRVEIVFRAGRR